MKPINLHASMENLLEHITPHYANFNQKVESVQLTSCTLGLQKILALLGDSYIAE